MKYNLLILGFRFPFQKCVRKSIFQFVVKSWSYRLRLSIDYVVSVIYVFHAATKVAVAVKIEFILMLIILESIEKNSVNLEQILNQ